MLEFQKTFDAVLFDMDGTLVDSRSVYERILQDWCSKHQLDADEVISCSHGRRTIDTVRQFATAGMDIEREANYIEAAETEDTDGIVAIPGAIELTRSLSIERWALVTSAGRELAKRRLNAAGVPLPKYQICAEDIDQGKPDPEGFLKAAELLGTKAENCLIFEDAPAGIEAGLRSGGEVVAITHAVPGEFQPSCSRIRDYSEVRFELT